MASFRRRTVLIGALVAVLAAAVNAGVAWAFWHTEGTGTAAASARGAVALEAVGTTPPRTALYPGGTAPLRVTIVNPNPFPIRIDAVAAGPGGAQADPAHRAAGCTVTGVRLTGGVDALTWPIGADETATFTLPAAVTMTNDSDSACQGATFTLPLRMSGQSAAR